MENEEIIARIRSGNKEVIKSVYKEHAKDIHSFAYSITGNYDSAMDVTKKTFIKLFTDIQHGEEPANIRLSALKIAYDEACRVALPSSDGIDSPFDREEPEEIKDEAVVVVPAAGEGEMSGDAKGSAEEADNAAGRAEEAGSAVETAEKVENVETAETAETAPAATAVSGVAVTDIAEPDQDEGGAQVIGAAADGSGESGYTEVAAEEFDEVDETVGNNEPGCAEEAAQEIEEATAPAEQDIEEAAAPAEQEAACVASGLAGAAAIAALQADADDLSEMAEDEEVIAQAPDVAEELTVRGDQEDEFYSFVIRKDNTMPEESGIVNVSFESKDEEENGTDEADAAENENNLPDRKKGVTALLIVLNVVLVLILIWLVYGLLSGMGIVPENFRFDLGYTWFSTNIYPIF